MLFVFLVPAAVMMHGKDLALAGAALMLFALFSNAGDDLGLTLTGPLFHLR